MGWAGTYSVTAYVGNVRFSRPVKVGDLVEATAQLIHTGRSSMHILVTVRSGNALDQLLTEATKCLMIFVTMGPDGRSTAVPPWQPITDEDREQQASAQRQIALRADIEAAMAAQQYTEKGTAPSVVLRFLAAPTDINWGGKVHGGIVMRWIDETAHVLASQWTASTANVAVYAGGVRFYQPLLIGHLVEVEARLLLTRTSHMHISVYVRSGAATSGALALTTHSLIVFAPLDSNRSVPVWNPHSAEDKALEQHALDLIRLRARVAS